MIESAVVNLRYACCVYTTGHVHLPYVFLQIVVICWDREREANDTGSWFDSRIWNAAAMEFLSMDFLTLKLSVGQVLPLNALWVTIGIGT